MRLSAANIHVTRRPTADILVRYCDPSSSPRIGGIYIADVQRLQIAQTELVCELKECDELSYVTGFGLTIMDEGRTSQDHQLNERVMREALPEVLVLVSYH